MHLYRIAKEPYARDLSGAGSRFAAGRWHPMGLPVIYTASSRALAALEVLAHIPASFVPRKYRLVDLFIPDENTVEVLDQSMLPSGWKVSPPGPETQRLGESWIRSNRTLVLKVPSALVAAEHNLLINPQHPDMEQVAIQSVERFEFDSRLL